MDKKKIGIIVGVIVLIALLVVSSLVSPKGSTEGTSSNGASVYENALRESNEITDEERVDYTEIDVTAYLGKYNDTEKSVILLGRETCQYCQYAKPILQKISKDYNVEIFYLDTDKFTEEDINDFIRSNEIFSESFGTPFLFVVQDGEILDSVDGLVDTASYVRFLRDNEMIK